MNVPEIRRQNRQAALHVLTGPVPLDQRLHGEPVTKIVEARPMTGRSTPQTDLPRQIVKRAPDLGAVQTRATAGHEEGLRPSYQETITLRGII